MNSYVVQCVPSHLSGQNTQCVIDNSYIFYIRIGLPPCLDKFDIRNPECGMGIIGFSVYRKIGKFPLKRCTEFLKIHLCTLGKKYVKVIRGPMKYDNLVNAQCFKNMLDYRYKLLLDHLIPGFIPELCMFKIRVNVFQASGKTHLKQARTYREQFTGSLDSAFETFVYPDAGLGVICLETPFQHTGRSLEYIIN